MLVKKKTTPSPIHGKTNKDIVRPICCTDRGEVAVYQVNEKEVPQVNQGDPSQEKKGTLILGDDGTYLHSVRVASDGTVIVRNEAPVDVTLEKVRVEGTVDVANTLKVKPITVKNIPTHFEVTQVPIKTQVMPIYFEGYGTIVIPEPCKVFAICLTVNDVTGIEIVDITGRMHTKEIKIDLFPLFVQVNKLEIKTREYVEVGGYVLYESC